MALNGWHRLWIVVAAAWALVVIGLATLEYHVGQRERGDGFFTCWEPYGSSPAAPAGTQQCGVISRYELPPGAFGSVLPGTRYLNTSRFSVILLGPVVVIAFCVLAISWIVHGFRSNSHKEIHAEVQRPRPPSISVHSGLPSSPAQPRLPSPSHAETWLHRLPRRWARNAAIGGGVLAALSTMPMLSKGDGAVVAFMLAGFAVVTLGITGAGYLCGRWARYSLKAPFMLNPASALARITPNWLTGAILLGALVLACNVLFGWRKTAPLFAEGISSRDWGYLSGFFGTWMLGGYLTALMSKRGLRKAIDTDRMPSPARAGYVSAPDGNSRQREYSAG